MTMMVSMQIGKDCLLRNELDFCMSVRHVRGNYLSFSMIPSH